MPSDITGTDIIEEDLTTGHRKWTFVEGPIFGNILLADEINRTPPKTQSALLEAMQEHSCTVRGHLYRLPAPFFVLATQNPIELEGTYPLPEAQLDRFLFNAILDYLSAEDELKVIDRTTTTRVATSRGRDVGRGFARFPATRAHGADRGNAFALRREPGARHTAQERKRARLREEICELWRQRPRGTVHCAGRKGARALAKRYHVTYDDITSVVVPVLRHRILLNFHAESDRIDADEILNRLIAQVPRPKES